jgi:hypothetical protein
MRFSLVLMLSLAAACGAPGTTVATIGGDRAKVSRTELPVVVEDDRFFLQTHTAAGQPLRLFLDSAGGLVLTKAAVQRLKLPVKRLAFFGEERDAADFPALRDAHVPPPKISTVPVVDDRGDLGDGMLGAPWFAGHVVTFDYAGKRLWQRATGDLPTGPAAHRIPMGLPRDASGNVVSPYGRIQMEVDGTAIDMLFDTGATVTLSPEARQQLGGTAAHRAGSFITRTVFEGWRKAHPDWRVIDAADEGVKPGFAMIKVPKVTIAGYEVGPVWFAARPDPSFHELMASLMDGRPEGALGGSAFRHFQRVTADWISGRVVFEK